MKKQDLELLVNTTFTYLTEKKIDPHDMNAIKKLTRNKDSVFSSISILIFGQLCYTEALKLRQMWVRDTNGNYHFYEFHCYECYLLSVFLKGYRSKVTEKFSEKSKLLIPRPLKVNRNNLIIIMSCQEWNDCLKFTSVNGKQRKRFTTQFDNLLSKKLQDEGFNCILRSTYNWFNQKKKGCQWSGRFKCFAKECRRVYDAKIWNITENCSIEIYINWLGECCHEKLVLNERICGKEREKIAENLLIDGIESFIEQKEIKKFVDSNGILTDLYFNFFNEYQIFFRKNY